MKSSLVLEKLKQIFNQQRLFLIGVFFCINLILNLTLSSDDVHNLLNYDVSNSFSWVYERYMTWSSRVFPDFFLSFSYTIDFSLTCLIIALFQTLFVNSISKLFKTNNSYILIGAVLIVVILANYPIFLDAGFIATNYNYFVPIAVYTYALVNIFEVYNNEEKLKPLTVIAIMLSCCIEQISAFSFGLLLILNLFYLLKTKKISYGLLTVLITTILMLLFILLSPGNEIRKELELTRFDPHYINYTLKDKLKIGLFYLNHYHLFTKILVSITLVLLAVSIKDKNYISIILNVFLLLILINDVEVIMDKVVKVQIEPIYFDNDMNLVRKIILENMFIIGLLSLSILFSVKNHKLIILVSIIGAILTKVMLGFSPTYIASGVRTMIPLIAIMLIVALYIFRVNFVSKED